MIQYSVEVCTESLIGELKPLLEDHWKEIAMFKDKISFSPDYEKYLILQDMGALHVVVVRDEGKIVGYFVSFIQPHIHYKDNIFAINDILYVDPSYRGGTVAYRMFKYAKKELKKIGVSVLMVHMKTKYPFEKLCESLGMDKEEFVYSVYLGD